MFSLKRARRLRLTGSGLEARDGKELRGFAVAGADRKFHWAHSRIDGDTVVVSSPEVAQPAAVRYGVTARNVIYSTKTGCRRHRSGPTIGPE